MEYDPLISDIREFVHVAELGNITNAANELFITQSALSKHLMRFEKSCRIKLFVRGRSGVTLTDNGKELYKYCVELLKHTDDFYNKMSGLSGVVFGQLRVGYQKVSEDMLFEINKSFAKKYPSTRIFSIRQENENFYEALKEKKYDIVFDYELGDPVAQGDIESFSVYTAPNMLLVSADGPLAQKSRVHLSELRDENFVLPSANVRPEKLERILEYCAQYGFVPKSIGSEYNYSAFINDIITYNAVAIFPQLPNMELSNRGLVKFIPLDGFPPTQSIAMMWLRSNRNSLIPCYLHIAKTLFSDTDRYNT